MSEYRLRRFAAGGRIARASGEQQSAAWGGGELPISHSDIEKNTVYFCCRTFYFLILRSRSINVSMSASFEKSITIFPPPFLPRLIFMFCEK